MRFDCTTCKYEHLHGTAQPCVSCLSCELWMPREDAPLVAPIQIIESPVAAAEIAPSAPALLSRATSIMAERGKQYDAPAGERSMGRAVSAFNAITGRDLQESEGWLLLQVLKDVRDRQRPAAHVDSLEDGIAYAALKAEARLAGR